MKQLLLRFVGAMALLFLFSNQLFSQGQSTTQGKDFWLSYGQNATFPAQDKQYVAVADCGDKANQGNTDLYTRRNGDVRCGSRSSLYTYV